MTIASEPLADILNNLKLLTLYRIKESLDMELARAEKKITDDQRASALACDQSGSINRTAN